jgi:hypothetical protein
VEYFAGVTVVDEVDYISALSYSLYFHQASRSLLAVKLQECAWGITKRFGKCVVVCNGSTPKYLALFLVPLETSWCMLAKIIAMMDDLKVGVLQEQSIYSIVRDIV